MWDLCSGVAAPAPANLLHSLTSPAVIYKRGEAKRKGKSSKEGILKSGRRSSVFCLYATKRTRQSITRVEQLSSAPSQSPIAFAAPDSAWLPAHGARLWKPLRSPDLEGEFLIL